MTTLTMLEKGLQISRPSRSFYINYYWLRDHCRSAFHPQTRERIFDIWAQQAAPQPTSAEILEDELRVRWKNEDVESRFDLDWLEKTIDQGTRADPAKLPHKFWYADQVEHMCRFTWTALENDPSAVAAWAKTLLEQGFALVTDLPDTDDAIFDLAGVLGPVSPASGCYHDEIVYHSDPVNAAFTTDALEMHTDTPSMSPPPGLKFFHCRTNTVEGGDNLYIDGFAVANDFRKRDPKDFDLLCRYPIPYVYQNEGFDYRARHTIIELDHRAEKVASVIRKGGRRAITVQADVSNPDDVERLFTQTDEQLGRVDVLVNNAGIGVETPVADQKVENIRRMIDVNLLGPMLTSRQAIRRMSTQRGGKGGTIINISSISAIYGGLPTDVVYAGTKGGLDSFTLGLCKEVAPEGIRVNCIRPGLIRTEMFDEGMGQEAAKALGQIAVPLGRIGEVEEIATATLWMCSREASYVNGATLNVSGGRETFVRSG